MNYLGHIYFSNNDLELMHANIFGDFVKGKDLSMYQPIVQEGILLHRKIDSFIGEHQQVRDLSKQLSSSLPKVSGIAIDVYFDHFLAKHWDQFHERKLPDFLAGFYAYKLNESFYPNDYFHFVLFRLKSDQWLSKYIKISGVDRACKSLSQRLSFPNALVNAGIVLEMNYQEIERVFLDFMSDAQNHFN
jgi:acyl carrier protein phosphodiesterase